jgi:hypothetical protein
MWTGLYVTLARMLIYVMLLVFVWTGSRVALMLMLVLNIVSIELLTAGVRFLTDALTPVACETQE